MAHSMPYIIQNFMAVIWFYFANFEKIIKNTNFADWLANDKVQNPVYIVLAIPTVKYQFMF